MFWNLWTPVGQQSKGVFWFWVLALQSKKFKVRNGFAQHGQQPSPNLDYFTERHSSA